MSETIHYPKTSLADFCVLDDPDHMGYLMRMRFDRQGKPSEGFYAVFKVELGMDATELSALFRKAADELDGKASELS